MVKNDTLDKLEFRKITEYISTYCQTESGKKKIRDLRPSTDRSHIVTEGNKIDYARNLLIKKDIPPLEYLPDLTDAIYRSRIEGVVLSSKEIREIYRLAQMSRKMVGYLKPEDQTDTPLDELRNALTVDKVFEKNIEKIFDENWDVKDDASPALKSIRSDIREKELSLQKTVNRLLKKLSEEYLVQEEYFTQRDGRIVLPVKAEHKRHVKGFIHSESSTGQTVYIEPAEILELNNDILSLKFAEKREIEKILLVITRQIAAKSQELLDAYNIITALDTLFARAKYALEIIGSIPTFDNGKPIELIDARHPILLKKLGFEATVPLNLKITDQKILVLTGPNAGGKTVALKTIGLLVLMAQSGIPIPCHPDSNLHIFEKVLVDIGDYQSIEDDLSTFSSHLTNIKSILENANESTLVLLDEVGTGTDPVEGAAIATGILISLRDKGALVVATTHHGSLKLIANQLDKFQNCSMEFDSEELKPTYRFNQGMPGSSYAFEIATRIGFDEKFIDLSKRYIDSDKTKIEEFLIDIEKKSHDLRNQIHNLELENLRLKSLANLYQDKINKLEKQKKEILEEAHQKANILLSDVNRKIENAIKNIRQSRADKEVIKKEKSEIETVKKKTLSYLEKSRTEESSSYKLNVGDYVSIKGTTSVGVLDEIDEDKDKALITIGSLKIKAKYSSLVPAKKSDFREYEKKKVITDYDHVKYRLDIRGMRSDEAEFEIIRFLDDSLMYGLERVEILHGKGTGALKQLAHSILKKYKGVKNYYFADIESGGDGITVVEFE
ncbi:MutS2 family protein [Melioribacter roseus P3M-2]|uniref:Endonuclease MutS2 n=1 Tax=Melioribacter roseus (strain DSM 23840 / JCM 17771 / VKM B-2668 / P3M-2) TaxID=1191523 RepID=I7A7D9_MELRP|nr:endonuclease MutS2 [Melioribacter roseus]AFN75796.1 MutS2 family protein [Melioribacter roseus P3M-2]